ncbi:TPA: ERF family protein, partial [Clostridioides difficile]|nr:ERF family protein [Clostridioides difficile]
METNNVYIKLVNIQSTLKAPKSQFNSFGKYNYRSCEDILEGLKPILKEEKALVILDDNIVQIGNRFYVEATATLIDAETGEKVSTKALA